MRDERNELTYPTVYPEGTARQAHEPLPDLSDLRPPVGATVFGLASCLACGGDIPLRAAPCTCDGPCRPAFGHFEGVESHTCPTPEGTARQAADPLPPHEEGVPVAPRPPYIQLWAKIEDGVSVGLQASVEITPERLRRLRTEAPRALERLLREVRVGTEES